MTTAELDALVLRANEAGHNSIAEYALALEEQLRIAQFDAGVTRGECDMAIASAIQADRRDRHG